MKVIIETPPPGGEEEILIRAYHLDERITELIQGLKTDSEKANELLESISETQGYVTGDLEELRDYFIQSEENEDEEEY